MYWVDWGSTRGGVIERASMDGTSREVIHSVQVTTPVSLALDSNSQTLYWIDSALLRMESSSVDGSNRRVLFSSSSTLQRTWGMAVFQNTIYWDQRNTMTLHSTSRLIPGIDVSNLWRASIYEPYEISIVIPSEQPQGKYIASS